jgi:hypothetical protein
MAVNEGVTRVFSVTVASGATSSSEVDLGAHFSRALINIPASNTWDTQLLVAADTGGTYANLYTGISTQFTVASSISNAMIPVENVGRWVKIEVTTAAADGASYNIVGIE